jgi:hypothetical protein
MTLVKMLTDATLFEASIPQLVAGVQTLPAGASPNVNTVKNGNRYEITFGIPAGTPGPIGATPEISIGTVSTLASNANVAVSFRGTFAQPIMDIGIPRGTTGATPTFTIGTVTAGAAGQAAAAGLRGTPENPVLDLTLPRGLTGALPIIRMGTVTTGTPGTDVVATFRGTPEEPYLDLTIPRGTPGAGDMSSTANLSDVINKDTSLANLGAGTGTNGGRALFKAADQAAAQAVLGLVPGTSSGRLVALDTNSLISASLIPVVLNHALDVVTPDSGSTNGGLRVRATTGSSATPNSGYIQFTNNGATATYGTLIAQQDSLSWSGQFYLPSVTAALATAFRIGTSSSVLSIAAYWNAQIPVVLSDAASVSLDMSTGVNFVLTMTSGIGNTRTLANPIGMKTGQSGWIRVIQDATGGRALTFGSNYRADDLANLPQLNTGASNVTVIRYFVTDSGEITLTGGKTNALSEASATEIRSAVAGKVITPEKAWQANQVATITKTDLVNGIDFRNFINATVTLDGTALIANPVAAGMKPGQSGVITFIVGNISDNYPLTFSDQWFSSNGVLPAFPTTAGTVMRMYYTIVSATSIDFFFAQNMGRTYDAQSSAYFAAMANQPSTARKNLIAALINGLKSDGIWNLLDNLWLLASHDEQSGRINVVRPNRILIRYGTPAFVVDKGWQSAVTDGQAGYTALQSPDPYFGAALKRNVVDGLSYGIWQNTVFSETQSGYLCGEGSNSFYDYMYYNNSTLSGRIATSSVTANVAQSKGLKAVSHVVGDANMTLFNNGTTTQSAYTSSTANTNSSFVLLSAGNPGSYIGTNNRQAAGFTGTGMSPAQLTALNARLNTYLTAIGAN